MNRRECLHLLTGLAGAALANEARAQGVEPKVMPTITPPDPNPKIPSFKLPAKSCDSHTHISVKLIYRLSHIGNNGGFLIRLRKQLPR